MAKDKKYLNPDYEKNYPIAFKLQRFKTDFEHSIIIKDKIIALNRFQKTVYDAHKINDTISISAPTSAGKSFILCNILLEELLTANKKIMHVYESFCTPLCKKYQLNQSDLDLILFIANNPMYNTAKDVCEIRGIKKGIVSVTTERLVQSGYLIRKNDIHDRRIQRLCLTEKCQPIIADGLYFSLNRAFLLMSHYSCLCPFILSYIVCVCKLRVTVSFFRIFSSFF